MVPVVVTFSAAAAMLVARNIHAGNWVVPLIFVASTGFILVALTRGALSDWYGRFVLLGLVGCWCGDMLGPRSFLAGLGAFLLAHVGFIAAFCANGMVWRRTLWALPVLALIDACLAAWLLPHVPAKEIGAVAAYITAISVMALFACGTSHNAMGRRALFGALLFFVSDIFVARWRYVDPNPINGNLCYPIYYTACVVLALTVTDMSSGGKRSD
jgi:uncharacterized membrane protein YhhN